MVKVLSLVLIIFSVAVLVIPPYLFMPANTYLAQLDVSLWTRTSVRERIAESVSRPIKIVVAGETKELTYRSLGIGIDAEELMTEASAVSIVGWWLSLDQMKWIRPAMAYEPDFQARVADLTAGSDYKVDGEDFQQRLAISFGSGVAIEPSLLADNWAAPTATQSGGQTFLDEEEVAGVSTGPVPNSLGNENGKYLEVDISDQKLYQIDNKKLIASHDVSTGLNYPTPTGRFRILNKAKSAYSGIFDVVMPYWMGFNYQTDIGAYVGIHELPYRVGSLGEKIYRFGNYIGTKKTGGCVALNPGEAEEVYAWVSEGMPVLIFD